MGQISHFVLSLFAPYFCSHSVQDKELSFVEEEGDDIFSDLISFVLDDNQKC